MRILLTAFATAGLAASPAVAQQQPAGHAPAKVKMVEKVVCQKVEEERSPGSRLSSTTKVCKKVLVPADEADKAGS